MFMEGLKWKYLSLFISYLSFAFKTFDYGAYDLETESLNPKIK